MPSRDDALAAYFLKAAGVAAVAVCPAQDIRSFDVAPLRRVRGAVVLCCRRGQEGRLAAALKAAGTAPQDPAERLKQIAAGQKIAVTDHAVLVDRARTYVRRINQEVDEMQRAGHLAAFNREFKAARKKDPTLRYADALQARKAAMIEAVALQLAR